MVRVLSGEQVDIPLQRLGKVDLFSTQLDRPSGLDSGQVEQLGHDTAQAFGLAVKMAEESCRAFRGHLPGEKDLGEALESREWRAQLMSNHGHELRLGPVQISQPFGGRRNFVLEFFGERALTQGQPSVLDREGDMKGHLPSGRVSRRTKAGALLHRESAERTRSWIEREHQPSDGSWTRGDFGGEARVPRDVACEQRLSFMKGPREGRVL